MEENKKRALESGNKLTQTLNEDGELVSVANTNTTETSMKGDNISVADVRKELFEGDNIVTSKNTGDGLSELEIMKNKSNDDNISTDATPSTDPE